MPNPPAKAAAKTTGPKPEIADDPVGALIGDPRDLPGAPIVITPPVPPASWTPATVATYAASVVLFVLGLLTLAGVTLPSGVSGEVQAWAGIVPTAVAALMPLWVLLSKHSVAKVAIKAGVDPAEALRL